MESPAPWKNNRWLPGVLNYKQLQELIDCGLIQNATGKIDLDASALDLHLSSEAYKMRRGSIKPFNKVYADILKDPYYADEHIKEADESFLLKTGNCYVFKIKEQLHPAITGNSPFYGQATAKSSIGRVDVIARLIVDGMQEYEKFIPDRVKESTGQMFLEITPITFDVKVKEDITLSQLRFCNGDFDDSIIRDEKFISSILNLSHPKDNVATLSVNVSNFAIADNVKAAAYCAKEKRETPIELWDKDKYNVEDFWDIQMSEEEQDVKSITIKVNNFYILRSVERISLPAGVCIYCRAMDETLGEMRIHYAGFVHPFFGLNRKDEKKGTPLIFEVRGHNVEVLLTQGEILARLFFYRMSELADDPDQKDTSAKQNIPDPYRNQELKLSNFFKPYKA